MADDICNHTCGGCIFYFESRGVCNFISAICINPASKYYRRAIGENGNNVNYCEVIQI